MKTLNDTYAKTAPTGVDADISKGANKKTVCASKFSDGQYYRCVCEGKTEDKTKYIIRYIDYGNAEHVGLKDIVALPQEVADIGLAAQATKYRLAFLNGPASDYMDEGTEF